LGIRKEDTIVEIGPGRGFLTGELLKSAASKIIVIEIDQRLLSVLQNKYADEPRLELHHADFIDSNLASLLPPGPVKIVGNLPYHLSAEIIYRLLEHTRLARHDASLTWIELAVLMTQKEVADRITAGPGSKTYGKLSVFVQLEANAYPVLTVPAGAFRPQPKVDGGVIRLEFLKLPEAYPRDLKLLERVVRYCFHQRRKMLKRTLSSLSGIHPFWQSANLDFTRRPETLSLSEWVYLADTITEHRTHIT
ncbi:ribosomal RNA small subunit methyltransferase A, partial [bacterium]|nr:ribosomal RNA small subunit methyltransferase A [bacterium]